MGLAQRLRSNSVTLQQDARRVNEVDVGLLRRRQRHDQSDGRERKARLQLYRAEGGRDRGELRFGIGLAGVGRRGVPRSSLSGKTDVNRQFNFIQLRQTLLWRRTV